MLKKWLLIGVLLFSLATPFIPSVSVHADWVCTQTYTVQRGDNLYRIARNHGTTIQQLQLLNYIPKINIILVGQVLCVAGEYHQEPTTYVVQRGDNLYRIARRFGVNLYTLAQVNGIGNINVIYVGQVLTIPVT